jgi:hypothetical protein
MRSRRNSSVSNIETVIWITAALPSVPGGGRCSS